MILVKDYRELVDKEFPPYRPVTKKSRENTINYSRGVGCVDVRIALGRFPTDEEYEERKKRVLNTPLP